MSSYHFLRHTHITSQVNSLVLCQDGWRSRLRHLTCHHMNLPVLHCKQRFSIRVSRDVYTQIPFKKKQLQLKAVHQPHSTDKVLDSLCVIFVLASPTSSINVVFPLLHKESRISRFFIWPKNVFAFILIHYGRHFQRIANPFEVGKDSSQVLVLGATNTPWDSMDGWPGDLGFCEWWNHWCLIFAFWNLIRTHVVSQVYWYCWWKKSCTSWGW